jgi:flavin-dependent dehydrogenase
MWDVIIAGGGPAGSLAAHVLAQSGRRVLFADADDFNTHKVGEALPGAALRILRKLSLPTPDSNGRHRPISGNLSSWNSEELVPSDFIEDPDGPGWRLDRHCFDRTLQGYAVNSGATFIKSSVVDVKRTGESWHVKLHDGAMLGTRWLIDATGRRAALARRLGAARKRDTPLVALYRLGKPEARDYLNRTVVESAPKGWWYAAFLPTGVPIAGLHVRPQDVAHFTARSEGWQRALSETRHIRSMFSTTIFDSPLSPLDASGARLDRFSGDGWVACGDAAMSFDPLSSQGIFSALHGGMTAGLAVAAALDGQREGISSYAARLEEIRRIYVMRLCSIYQSERRWRSESFWSTFQSS